MFALWLAAHNDIDVFLTDVDESKCPLVVSWYYRKHMVIFELPVSEYYGGVDLISIDHELTWGVNLTNDPKHTHRVPFEQWLTTLAKNLVNDWRLDTSNPIMCEQCDSPKPSIGRFDER